MNIAIYTSDFPWAGGIDFLHGVVKGILSQTKRDVRVFILVNDSARAPAVHKGLVGNSKILVKTAARSILRKSFFKRLPNPLPRVNNNNGNGYNLTENVEEIFLQEDVVIIYYRDNNTQGLLNVLEDISADIVLPVLVSLPANFKIPWVGYLFDFVYKYFTHLYTNDFCLETDIMYASTLLKAKSVIVNSQNTRLDIEKYFPYAKSKVYSLPFAPYTNQQTYNRAVSQELIKNKYDLKKRYFIISNQFWLHKSHETAFRALAILRRSDEFRDVEIVCTGLMTDLSGTDVRRLQLERFGRELELQNSIHFLGHIPKIDQLALMLRSVAVVQPTLFEGGPGGGSVYMAVANGIPTIVSDIPVNKEIQNETLVTFFKASNPEDLAEKMGQAVMKKRNIETYTVLDSRNKKRLEAVGNTILDCIEYTIGVY
jgi:glycosyltransferase involved in cell wall biosynthesis